MEVVEEDEKVTFTYKFQPECANSMEELSLIHIFADLRSVFNRQDVVYVYHNPVSYTHLDRA